MLLHTLIRFKSELKYFRNVLISWQQLSLQEVPRGSRREQGPARAYRSDLEHRIQPACSNLSITEFLIDQCLYIEPHQSSSFTFIDIHSRLYKDTHQNYSVFRNR